MTVDRYETDRVIIADGLAKGDVVVTAGVNRLRQDQRCASIPEAAKAAAPPSPDPDKPTGFNLSEWALRHRSLVVDLMIVLRPSPALWAYFNLGREEDPPFTIKTMVVKTLWPGATTIEMWTR